MFPYRDENPTSRFPAVTIALILINIIVWVLFQGMGFNEAAMANALCNWGIIPGELTSQAVGQSIPVTNQFVCVIDPAPNYFTLISTQFLHGGWLHLIGNMMFLWVFGNNIEDSMGHGRFLTFYLLCGVAAGLAQVMSSPASPIPAVGASGAVSGVLGAYLILFPRVRVWMLVPIFIIFFRVALPAWVYLIYWAGIQFLSGLAEQARGGADVSGGVAFWAHVGGFVAGMILVSPFLDKRTLRYKRHAHWADRLERY